MAELTDAQVQAAARPGESWEQARARLASYPPAVPNPCAFVWCGGSIPADAGPWEDLCAACRVQRDDDEAERHDWDEVHAEAERDALKAAGLWEAACAKAKALADADPIPFDPVPEKLCI